MDVRSVTCFIHTGTARTRASAFKAGGRLTLAVRDALGSAGFPVQTARLATQPLSLIRQEPLPLAAELSARCADLGFDYLSLGPVLADAPDADLSRLALIPDLLRAQPATFASVLVARKGAGIHLDAIRRTAGVVREIAHTTDLGFGNLRFAALANVGPLAPFYPTAYHDGGTPAVALAVEGASLAVAACEQAGSLDEVRARLVDGFESAAGQMAGLVEPLARQHGYRFAGVDLSLAPFPEQARSIGAAIEHLGAQRFGAAGTLFAAAFLTSCLGRARFPRCGFNGLMLPVLEDSTLAERSREQLFTVNDLLLYSAVCGTGLDTVPLPGDMGEEELAGILLDVAALALRLDKPLTARLMPIPGAAAGDRTRYEFAYFANCRVLGVKGVGSPKLFHRAAWFAL